MAGTSPAMTKSKRSPDLRSSVLALPSHLVADFGCSIDRAAKQFKRAFCHTTLATSRYPGQDDWP
jgi:hypothetical protein